jgi:hypothetical protein
MNEIGLIGLGVIGLSAGEGDTMKRSESWRAADAQTEPSSRMAGAGQTLPNR